MTSGPEWEKVERPLLEHLFSLGWETLIWSQRQAEGVDARSSDRDVLLERRLGLALEKINGGPDGVPWLDEARIGAAVAELRSMAAGAKLLEANRLSTELLLGGVTVAGLDGWDGRRDQIVDYIDWDDWEANDFLAVSQFAVATPGRAPNIRPDVTLFVNGIPLVVIEAKPPGHDSGVTDAIDQLRRYANQRGSEVAEGAEQLFWTNQFTVASTGERAEAATFSALPEHYLAWKDPFPSTVGEVAASLGKPADAVTQQELLAAGMLAPERLLDIVRHFTLFMEAGSGRTVKVVGRYQQYRGVHKALRRLIEGDTRPADGHVDRRGGIIWHTQGSGKSLTMVFLIRAMRSHPDLRRFKIVLVTDRTDLERQLRSTAELAGETVSVARSGSEVRALLGQEGPGVVMAMIQKYRDTAGGDGEDLAPGETFDTLNESGSILVMVDEAHRSQATVLHANLMAALPNAARIGFTGTPIIMGERKKTLEIFGGYLDRYTLAESEADGSTVPIFYEGRTTDAAVRGASKMDDLFYRWFQDLSDDQRKTLQHRYATAAQVLEAPELIAAKAKDILRHYIATVMPDGFKGMVVATSREACLRYHRALTTARDELVAEIEQRAIRSTRPAWRPARPRRVVHACRRRPSRPDPQSQLRAGDLRRPQRSAPLRRLDRQAGPAAAHRPVQAAARSRRRGPRPARAAGREVDAAYRVRRAPSPGDLPRSTDPASRTAPGRGPGQPHRAEEDLRAGGGLLRRVVPAIGGPRGVRQRRRRDRPRCGRGAAPAHR